KRLHVFFGDSFGSPHDISWVNRLVRGHENEFLYAEFNREISQQMRAEDIGPNALAGVVFHHRYMLVSRSVIDVMRFESFKQQAHALLTADVRYEGVVNLIFELIL